MTIVVAYVPTPEGDAALEQAAREASTRHGGLIVVDLARPPELDRDELAARVARAAGPQVPVQLRSVEDGRDAVDTVLQLVADESASLLVIGLRRRTPVGKLILGAQAQRILLDAACPVLAVKPARVE